MALLLFTLIVAVIAVGAQAQADVVPECSMNTSHFIKDGKPDLKVGLALLGQPDAYCEKHKDVLPALVCNLLKKRGDATSPCIAPVMAAALGTGNPIISAFLASDPLKLDLITDKTQKHGKQFCECFATLPMHSLCPAVPAGQDDCRLGGVEAPSVRKIVETCVATYHDCALNLGQTKQPLWGWVQKDDTENKKTCAAAALEHKARKGKEIDACPRGVTTTQQAPNEEQEATGKSTEATQAATTGANDEQDGTTTNAATKPATNAAATSSAPTVAGLTVEQLKKVKETAETLYNDSCKSDTEKKGPACQALEASSAAASAAYTKAKVEDDGDGSAASGLSPLLATCVAGIAVVVGVC